MKARSSREDEGNQRKHEVDKRQDELRASRNKNAEFEEFWRASRDQLSIDDMQRILQANELDSSGRDVVIRGWYCSSVNSGHNHHLLMFDFKFFIAICYGQDMLFYGVSDAAVNGVGY